MSKNITIYTTKTCGYCNMLKSYLDDKKINYSEKHVDQDYAAAQEMIAKSGQMGVPFSVITDDKGKEEAILGFDKRRFEEILA